MGWQIGLIFWNILAIHNKSGDPTLGGGMQLRKPPPKQDFSHVECRWRLDVPAEFKMNSPPIYCCFERYIFTYDFSVTQAAQLLNELSWVLVQTFMVPWEWIVNNWIWSSDFSSGAIIRGTIPVSPILWLMTKSLQSDWHFRQPQLYFVFSANTYVMAHWQTVLLTNV